MKKIMLFILCVSCYSNWQALEFTYNSRNMLSSVDYGNGYLLSYGYDFNGNLVNQTITQPNVSPLIPTQFIITSNGDLNTLSWEPVTSNINGTPIIVPLYVIEASSDPTTGFSLIGTTNQTQYTLSSSIYPHRFYRVRATVNYQRDGVQPVVQTNVITKETRSNE